MLHHHEDGPADAPVLVLGPSLGTDLHLFDPQLDSGLGRELASCYRVIRYDLPGHGRSPVPDGPQTMSGLADAVIELLDALGVDRFHYAGVSIGGAIGQELAVDHPERVATLTAIATAARFADPASWPRRAALVREQGTHAMVDSRLGLWFTPTFADTHPDTVRWLLDMLEATSDEGYAACCEALGPFDLCDRLTHVQTPTLAIAGADDPSCPPPMVQLLAYTIPGASFRTVAGVAHLPNVERPDEVTRALLSHLAQHPDPTR
jgi:3-oxoadipate enol-lactonase